MAKNPAHARRTACSLPGRADGGAELRRVTPHVGASRFKPTPAPSRAV